MSWAVVEQRIATKARLPASIRLAVVGRAKNALPTCIIAFKNPFATSLGWKGGDQVGLSIGEGEDAGKLRLTRGSPKAIAALRMMKAGTFSFDLGHVPVLGKVAQGKVRCEATMIDADTVDIVFPGWADEDDDDEVEEQQPRAPAVKPGASAPGSGRYSMHGVAITLTQDAEKIAFKGKEMDLTDHQAALAVMLLRAAPSPIAEAFARNKLLGQTAHAEERFKVIVSDLTRALAAVGLKLKAIKGVGLSLEGLKT